MAFLGILEQRQAMNTFKQMLRLSAKNKLELSKEIVEYIASIIPPAVSNISPEMSPEVAAIFATSLKSTCFKIVDKASEFLDEGADIREIDVDWRANYFDKCRLVHDDDMQILWARILAGEANNLGTYSKRSVNSIADIDKRDAQLFTELCRYVCKIKYTYENIEKIEFIPLIFDNYLHTKPLYVSTLPNYHIRAHDLDHLDNIGLIRVVDYGSDEITGEYGFHFRTDVIKSDVPIEANYYDESIRLSNYPAEGMGVSSSGLPIGKVKLTQIGSELYPICGSTPVDGFFSRICRFEWLAFIKNLDEEKAKEITQSTHEKWEREPPVITS